MLAGVDARATIGTLVGIDGDLLVFYLECFGGAAVDAIPAASALIQSCLYSHVDILGWLLEDAAGDRVSVTGPSQGLGRVQQNGTWLQWENGSEARQGPIGPGMPCRWGQPARRRDGNPHRIHASQPPVRRQPDGGGVQGLFRAPPTDGLATQ